jgi:hypothetical protein
MKLQVLNTSDDKCRLRMEADDRGIRQQCKTEGSDSIKEDVTITVYASSVSLLAWLWCLVRPGIAKQASRNAGKY